MPSTAPLTGPFSSVKFSSELEEFVPSTAPLTGPFSEKFEEKIQPSWRIESRKRYQCTSYSVLCLYCYGCYIEVTKI